MACREIVSSNGGVREIGAPTCMSRVLAHGPSQQFLQDPQLGNSAMQALSPCRCGARLPTIPGTALQVRMGGDTARCVAKQSIEHPLLSIQGTWSTCASWIADYATAMSAAAVTTAVVTGCGWIRISGPRAACQVVFRPRIPYFSEVTMYIVFVSKHHFNAAAGYIDCKQTLLQCCCWSVTVVLLPQIIYYFRFNAAAEV